MHSPLVLIILDGWGLSPSWGGNVINMTNPPFVNSLWRDYPHLILQAFKEIGKTYGKVGNSEIGHGLIGSGRTLEQEIDRIDKTISNGQFFKNQTFVDVCDYVKNKKSSLHLMGLISDGAIHSHINHLYSLINLAKKQGVEKLYIHAFLDGQDTKPTSGIVFLTQLQAFLKEKHIGKISTLSGRFFAMDRDGHWDRTQRAYQALTKGKGIIEESPLHAIVQMYKKGFNDTAFPPVIIKTDVGKTISKDQLIKDRDGVIFFNFREDRVRQLTRAFVDPSFRPFWCFKKPKVMFVAFTKYISNLPVKIAFPPIEIKNCLTEIISKNGLRQLHIAESEKYAHITYFINCGKEEPFKNEGRIIVSSPRIDSFDKVPEMKTKEVVDKIISSLKKYDFIVSNFANVDIVGHTGNIIAAGEAVKSIDNNLERLTKEILEKNGILIITADHGNAEQMIHLQDTGDPETLHTLNPVPFILVGNKFKKKKITIIGNIGVKTILKDIIGTKHNLSDIAPTILELLKLSKPEEMTGESLLNTLLK